MSSLGFEWEIEKKSQHESQMKISKNKLKKSRSSYIKKTPQKVSQNTNELEEHWSRIIDKMTVDKIPVVLYIQVIKKLLINYPHNIFIRCTIAQGNL